MLHNDLVALGPLVTLRADPDTIIVPVGGTVFPNQLRIVAVNGDGRTVGRMRVVSAYSLQEGVALTLIRPDSIRALAVGRQMVRVEFNPALSAGRATPFPPLTFTIIVR